MLNVTVLTVLFYISLKKVKSYFLGQRICIFPTFFFPFFLVGWLGKCQSIKKSGRQTFRERFVSSSLFVSPCPLECYFQTETRIEPDLNLFTLEIPVNIVITLTCTGHWSWNVLNALCTITTRFVFYVITRSPRREITSKRAFFGVTIVEQLHTKTPRRSKPIFNSLLKRKTKEMTDFSSLSNSCAFYFRCRFSIKFSPRYLGSGFIA